MNDRSHSDDVELTAHERLALLRIEAELGRDRRLARRMSTSPPRVWLPLTAAVLMCASVVLGVLGIRTSDPALVWGFAVVWPLTLLTAFRLLCRVTENGDRATRATPWV
ncbi:DUF3040 domain-containing protein [Streptomyces sp. NPDC051636]|uniref:DUF3040 domain-containing protein n=1 Tax=Streptomyces sp. NPDC051636 TaxID=3365663 RepID=UPI0037981375